MNLVWKHSKYSGAQLITLLALADWSDDDGISWPSVKKLADKSRQTERSVQNCIRLFRGDGILEVEQRINNSNVFTLKLKKIRGEKFAPGENDDIKDPVRGERGSPNTSMNLNYPPNTLDTPSASDSPMADGDVLVVQELFDYFVLIMDKSKATILTQKRLVQGKKCLDHARKITKDEESAKELIRQVIHQMSGSDFHNAKGKYVGQTKYNDWEQIFGSIDKFQKWVERTVESGN